MNLQGVVGIRLGDPGGQNISHAGLDIATPAGILLQCHYRAKFYIYSDL